VSALEEKVEFSNTLLSQTSGRLARRWNTEALDLIAAGTRLSEAERADLIQVGEGVTVRALDEMTAARPAAVPAATVALPGPVFAPEQWLAGPKALS